MHYLSTTAFAEGGAAAIDLSMSPPLLSQSAMVNVDANAGT